MNAAVGVAVGGLVLLGLASPASAQRNFLYVSHSGERQLAQPPQFPGQLTDPGPGSISGFEIAEDGTLTAVPGSPIAAGGNNTQGLAIRDRHLPGLGDPGCVYVANFDSGNVAAFRIEPRDGALTATAGTGDVNQPIALAVSPEGRFLYAANHNANTISAFRIGDGCELSAPLTGSPFATNSGPTWGLSVSPDRVLYAVGENSGDVAAMEIARDGTLSHISGSPFPTAEATLLDSAVSRLGTRLHVSMFNPNQLQTFVITGDGSLVPLAATAPADPNFPTGLVPSRDDRRLYVANGGTTVSGFNRDATSGNASGPVPGSPFPAGGRVDGLDALAGTRTGGHFLYAGSRGALPTPESPNADQRSTVTAYAVDGDGALSPIPGSPFQTQGVGGPGHFSLQTISVGPSIAYRSAPGRLVYRGIRTNNLLIVRTDGGSTVTFADERPMTHTRSSGCSTPGIVIQCRVGNPTVGVDMRTGSNNRVNANNGFPEVIVCTRGRGDTVIADLQDTVRRCDEVRESPEGTGQPAFPARRASRVRRGRAAVRLRCAKNRQGNRCRGRLAIRRGKRQIGATRYSIRTGRARTVRVPLRRKIRKRANVLLVAKERSRDRRPMTTRARHRLRPR